MQILAYLLSKTKGKGEKRVVEPNFFKVVASK